MKTFEYLVVSSDSILSDESFAEWLNAGSRNGYKLVEASTAGPRLIMARAVEEPLPEPPPSEIRMEDIIYASAEQFNVNRHQIIGRETYASIVRARHVAIYLIREMMRVSYPKIGHVFHRDHSTILMCCRKVAEAIKAADASLVNDIAGVRERVAIAIAERSRRGAHE